ncbi:MAG: sensor histidine kinase [Opitutaceae bacterium]
MLRTGEGFVAKPEKTAWDDGRVTWALTTKLPLRNARGEIVGTFGISKDITEEKRLESSLEEAHRELIGASRLAGMAEVATGVLHNVGNVLGSLNVSAALISKALRDSKAGTLAKASELIHRNAAQLGRFFTRDPKGQLIPDFLSSLAHALAEERKRILEEAEALRRNIDHVKEIVAMQQAYASTAGALEALAPAALMEDSLRMNSSVLGRDEVELVRDFREVSPVRAQRGKALQILINLIRNAKHAVDEASIPDKIITLRIAPGPGGRVRLTVRDNGVGIPAENLTRIFAHGFTTRPGGHGFGLHSSALAARELGGSLTVASDGPNTGSAFTLELPAARPNPDHS